MKEYLLSFVESLFPIVVFSLVGTILLSICVKIFLLVVGVN